MTSGLDTSAVVRRLKESPQQKVKIAVVDIDGVPRGKYLNKEKLLDCLDSGMGFCSVVFGWDAADACYTDGLYTGAHTGYPDATIRLDPASFRQIPWDQQVPFFLGDFWEPSGKPLPICPRQLLKRAIELARERGFEIQCGMEFEWFNFNESAKTLRAKGFQGLDPLTPGMFGYSLLRSSQNPEFFHALMDELGAFGVPIEGLHTETGPGVIEAAIRYSDALEAADRAVLFKAGTKEIAHRFGIAPTFMAKWKSDLPGCSGHMHLSLWNRNKSQNLFYDESRPHRMSHLFDSFLAGQIAALPQVLPFFAPTVNSYKRLVEGFWAPTQVTWGVDNRTTSYRVIPGSKNSTRLEVRVPGADVNPYLAMAAAILTGIWGIDQELELSSAPIAGNAYVGKAERLPRNLGEATERMSESKLAFEVFGEAFLHHFIQTRRWEWKRFQESVTQWELERYFEII